MNKIYRLKFKRHTRELVVVSENTKGVSKEQSSTNKATKPKQPRTLGGMLAAGVKAVFSRAAVWISAFFGASLAITAINSQEVNANVLDGKPITVIGDVKFKQDKNLTEIHTKGNSVIKWQSFNIGKQEIVNFIQQNSNNAVLNRVVGNQVSHILGNLKSNGRVFIINPNGIVFDKDSTVNVGGLIASTLDISDQDFVKGKLNFEQQKKAAMAAILNQGLLSIDGKGHIMLIGGQVTNQGVLRAANGNVYLLAGQKISIGDLNNPSINYVIAAGSKAVNLSSIFAKGKINLVASQVENTGSITATDKNGVVELFGEGDNSFIYHSGSINAHNINIQAKDIAIDKFAQVRANANKQDAGHVLIGASKDNANSKVSGFDLGTGVETRALTIAQGSKIFADAVQNAKAVNPFTLAGVDNSKFAKFNVASVAINGKKAFIAGKIVANNQGLVSYHGMHAILTDSVNVDTKNGLFLLDVQGLNLYNGTGLDAKLDPFRVKDRKISNRNPEILGSFDTYIGNVTLNRLLKTTSVSLVSRSEIKGEDLDISGPKNNSLSFISLGKINFDHVIVNAGTTNLVAAQGIDLSNVTLSSAKQTNILSANSTNLNNVTFNGDGVAQLQIGSDIIKTDDNLTGVNTYDVLHSNKNSQGSIFVLNGVSFATSKNINLISSSYTTKIKGQGIQVKGTDLKADLDATQIHGNIEATDGKVDLTATSTQSSLSSVQFSGDVKLSGDNGSIDINAKANAHDHAIDTLSSTNINVEGIVNLKASGNTSLDSAMINLDQDAKFDLNVNKANGQNQVRLGGIKLGKDATFSVDANQQNLSINLGSGSAASGSTINLVDATNLNASGLVQGANGNEESAVLNLDGTQSITAYGLKESGKFTTNIGSKTKDNLEVNLNHSSLSGDTFVGNQKGQVDSVKIFTNDTKIANGKFVTTQALHTSLEGQALRIDNAQVVINQGSKNLQTGKAQTTVDLGNIHADLHDSNFTVNANNIEAVGSEAQQAGFKLDNSNLVFNTNPAINAQQLPAAGKINLMNYYIDGDKQSRFSAFTGTLSISGNNYIGARAINLIGDQITIQDKFQTQDFADSGLVLGAPKLKNTYHFTATGARDGSEKLVDGTFLGANKVVIKGTFEAKSQLHINALNNYNIEANLHANNLELANNNPVMVKDYQPGYAYNAKNVSRVDGSNITTNNLTINGAAQFYQSNVTAQSFLGANDLNLDSSNLTVRDTINLTGNLVTNHSTINASKILVNNFNTKEDQVIAREVTVKGNLNLGVETQFSAERIHAQDLLVETADLHAGDVKVAATAKVASGGTLEAKNLQAKTLQAFDHATLKTSENIDADSLVANGKSKVEAQIINSTNIALDGETHLTANRVNVTQGINLETNSSLSAQDANARMVTANGSNVLVSEDLKANNVSAYNGANVKVGSLEADVLSLTQASFEANHNATIGSAELYVSKVKVQDTLSINNDLILDGYYGKNQVAAQNLDLNGHNLYVDGSYGSEVYASQVKNVKRLGLAGGGLLHADNVVAQLVTLIEGKNPNGQASQLTAHELTTEGLIVNSTQAQFNVDFANIKGTAQFNNTYQQVKELKTGTLLLKNSGLSAEKVQVAQDITLTKGAKLYAAALSSSSLSAEGSRVQAQNFTVGSLKAAQSSVINVNQLNLDNSKAPNHLNLDNSILKVDTINGGTNTVVDLDNSATFNAQKANLGVDQLNVKDSSTVDLAGLKANQVNLDGIGSVATVESDLTTNTLSVAKGSTLNTKKDLNVAKDAQVIGGNLQAGSLKAANLQADQGASVVTQELTVNQVKADHSSSVSVADHAETQGVTVLNKSTFEAKSLNTANDLTIDKSSSANLGNAKVAKDTIVDHESSLKAHSLTGDSLKVTNKSTANVDDLQVATSTSVVTNAGLTSDKVSTKDLTVTDTSNLEAGKVAAQTTTIKDNSTAKVAELKSDATNLKAGAKVDLGKLEGTDLHVSASAVTANDIHTDSTTVSEHANVVAKDLTATTVTHIDSGKVVVKNKFDTGKFENNGELQADKIKLNKLNLGDGKSLSSNELSAHEVTLHGNANLNVNKLDVDQELLVTSGSQVNAQSVKLNQAKVKTGGMLKADDITASSGIYLDSGKVSAGTINTNELGASVNSQVAATASITADSIKLDNSALNSASLKGKTFTSVGASVSAGQSALGMASISSSNVNSDDLNVIYLDLNQGSKLVSNKVVASQVTINDAILEAAVLQVDNGIKLENAANLKASQIVGTDIQIEKSKLTTDDLSARNLIVGADSDVHVANQLNTGTLKTKADLNLNDVKADAVYLENGNKVTTHNLVASDVKVANGSSLNSNDITTERFKATNNAQVKAHNLAASDYVTTKDGAKVQVSNLKTGRLAVDNSFVTVDNQATTVETDLTSQAVLSANRVATGTLHVDNSTLVVNSLDAKASVDLTDSAGLKVRDHFQTDRLSVSDSVVRSAADANKFNSLQASNSTLVLTGQTDTTSAKLDHAAIYGTEGKLNVAGHAELSNHSAVEVGTVNINNLDSQGNNVVHALNLSLTGNTRLETTEVKARHLYVKAGNGNFETKESAISVTNSANIEASSVTMTDSVLLGDNVSVFANRVDLKGKTRVLAGNFSAQAQTFNYDDDKNIKADNISITCDTSNRLECKGNTGIAENKGSIGGNGHVALSTAEGQDSSKPDSTDQEPSTNTVAKTENTVSSSSNKVAETIKTAITGSGTGSAADDSASSGAAPVVGGSTILGGGNGSSAQGSASGDDGIFSDTAKSESAAVKADKEESLAAQAKAKDKADSKTEDKDDKDKKDRKDKDSDDSNSSTTSETGTVSAQNVSPVRRDIENIADNLGLTSAINKAVAQVDKQVGKTINNAVNTAVANVNSAVDSVQRNIQSQIDKLQKGGVTANALPYGQSDRAFTAVTRTNIQSVFSALRTQEAIAAAKAKAAPVTVTPPKSEVPTVVRGIGQVNAVVSNGLNNAQVAARVSQSNIPGFYSVNRTTKEYTYNLQYGDVQLSCERGTMQGVSATCVQVPSADSNPGNVVSGLSSVKISGK